MESFRHDIFVRNMALIESHNKQENASFQMGVNQFADMTQHEFRVKILHSFRHGSVRRSTDVMNDDLPGEVDHRKEGIVSEVRSGGVCSPALVSAFVSVIESEAAQVYKRPVFRLSTQQFVDCSLKSCSGATLDDVKHYILSTDGLMSELDYPPSDKIGECKYDKSKGVVNVIATIDTYFEKDKENGLKGLVSLGTIMSLIDASTPAFMFYQSGILEDDKCLTDAPNHAVVTVGYGSEGGKDYWIVQNSWGTNWGEEGYVRIARNAGNMCGIASNATQVVVKPN